MLGTASIKPISDMASVAMILGREAQHSVLL